MGFLQIHEPSRYVHETIKYSDWGQTVRFAYVTGLRAKKKTNAFTV
jgi:hypothetical protein